MAKRVLVERLRPQTQQEVVVRPVDTYIQPPQVQEGSLQDLARFIDRIQPTVGRLAAERERQLAEEDIKKARKLAETTSQTYNELVKAGEIGPEESPVFRYAFNETRGESSGYEFIQYANDKYRQGAISGATDASTFDDWYQQTYQEYYEQNKDFLDQDGAFEAFSKTANQARNNLLNKHLNTVGQNFKSEVEAGYDNFIVNLAATSDFSTPEGLAQYQQTLRAKQADITSTGGPAFNNTVLNQRTVDALVSHYENSGYNYEGLELALNATKAGTGSLAGTKYARDALGKAQVDFEIAQIKEQERKRKVRTLYEEATEDFMMPVFINGLGNGQDPDEIYESLDDGDRAAIDMYHPNWRLQMQELSNRMQSADYNVPMSSQEEVAIYDILEATPPKERVAKVTSLVDEGRIKNNTVLNKALTYARSTRDADARGINLHPSQDLTYKNFNEKDYESIFSIGDNGKARGVFKVEYYRKFAETMTNEKGETVRVWDTMSDLEKLEWLQETAQRVIGTARMTLGPANSNINPDPDGPPIIKVDE
jgi:hypothetical protein